MRKKRRGRETVRGTVIILYEYRKVNGIGAAKRLPAETAYGKTVRKV